MDVRYDRLQDVITWLQAAELDSALGNQPRKVRLAFRIKRRFPDCYGLPCRRGRF